MAKRNGNEEQLPQSLLKDFNAFTVAPEKFLEEQSQLAHKIKSYTKTVYDSLKFFDSSETSTDALPELIIKHFDDEQIWQQIELQNTPSIGHFIGGVSKIKASKQALTFAQELEVDCASEEGSDVENGKENDESESESESEEEDNDDDELLKDIKIGVDAESDSDADLERLLDEAEAGNEDDDEEVSDADKEEEEEDFVGKKKTKPKSSVVDDQFFKLSEMEEFLTQEDAREERQQKRGNESEGEDSDDAGMFQKDDDDKGMNPKYEDYFKLEPGEKADRKKKKVAFDLENDEMEDKTETKKKKLLDSDSEGEDADEILGRSAPKSGFEERQEKLAKKIKALETANIQGKNWQMIGEIDGVGRPENSLLQEDLDFDHTTKLPPVITEETTVKLEDIIKQRIKDKAYDDVERKTKTKEEVFEYKKRIALSQEKSKQSLSEIYAQEYMKQNDEKTEAEEDPKREEIKKMMQGLFLKLDALSNFHYTPKPAIADVKVVTNMPSISIEEVAPVSVSDGQLLAPEEVKDKKKGLEIGQTERSETDRLRERRQKKVDKRKRVQEKEKRQKLVEKQNPGLGNKYSKDKALKQLEKDSKTETGVTLIKEKSSSNKNTSSKKFFQQLQEEVTTQVKSKKALKTLKKSKKSSQNFML